MVSHWLSPSSNKRERKDTAHLCKELYKIVNPEWTADLWKKFRLFLRGSLRKADWDKFVYLSLGSNDGAVQQFNELIRSIIYNAQLDVPPPKLLEPATVVEEATGADGAGDITLLEMLQHENQAPDAEDSVYKLRLKVKEDILLLPTEVQQRILSCLYAGSGRDDLPSGLAHALPPLRQPSLPFACPENEPANLLDSMPATCVQTEDLQSRADLAKRLAFYMAQYDLQPHLESEAIDFLTIALEMYMKQFLSSVLIKSIGVRGIMSNITDVENRVKSLVTLKNSKSPVPVASASSAPNPNGAGFSAAQDSGSALIKNNNFGSGASARTRFRTPSDDAKLSASLSHPIQPLSAVGETCQASKRPFEGDSESSERLRSKRHLEVSTVVPPRTHIYAAYSIPRLEITDTIYWQNNWSSSVNAGHEERKPRTLGDKAYNEIVRVDSESGTADPISLVNLLWPERRPSVEYPQAAQCSASAIKPALSQNLESVKSFKIRDKRRPFSINDILFATELTPKLLTRTPNQREIFEKLTVLKRDC